VATASATISVKQVEIPKTPAGQCANDFIKAFNSGNREELQAFVQKYRAKTYIEERSAEEKMINWYMIVHGSAEGFTPVSVSYSKERQIVVTCRASNSGGLAQIYIVMGEESRDQLVSLTIIPLPPDASLESVAIDSQLIGGTIASIAEVLRRQYVYPEKGNDIASTLEKYYSDGKYSGISDGSVLALFISEDLRAISNDGHLGLQFGKPPGDVEVSAQMDKDAASCNYYFRKVEVLPNNIGYIAFDRFLRNEEALTVAAKSLEKVNNCDAVIFDLRRNNGGASDMISFIAGYLFDKPTLFGIHFSRITDEYSEFFSQEEVPGKRIRSEVPVYVLISSYTYSAAEAFALSLQELGRATIVGESSGGGAHTVEREAINDHFWINMPSGRGMGPVSRKDWEGTGVIPDIEVSAHEALEIACEHALKSPKSSSN